MTLDELDNRDLLPGDPDAPGRSGPGVDRTRAADLRLARLHLRLGSLALARAELEAAHADADLAGDALLDLAEVRWRTGDLAAAGAAAVAWLAAPGSEAPALARVIAVEAALAAGRPSDARAHHEAVVALSTSDLEAIFNGLPRGTIWPAQEGASGATATRPAGGISAAAVGASGEGRPGRGAAGSGAVHDGGAPSPRLDAVVELAAARSDLEAGDVTAAAVRLAVVLRLAPHLAPAVLEVVEDADGPLIDLVRGDAFRLVGRATEAERAWRTAAGQLSRIAPARDRRAPGGSGTAPYASPSTVVPAAGDTDQSSVHATATTPAPDTEDSQ